MKKLLVSMVVASSAFAATTSTATKSKTNISNLWAKLKESPASLSYSGSISVAKNTSHEVDAYSSSQSLTFAYKLSKNDRISFYNKYITNENSKTSDNDVKDMNVAAQYGASADYGFWERSQLTYSRSGLKTQDKHGYNLSAGVDVRYYPEGTYREQIQKRYGLVRPHITMTKSWKNGFSVYNKLNYAKNVRQEGLNSKENSDGYLYLITDQMYSINDKVSIGITEEWFTNYNMHNGESYVNSQGQTAKVRTPWDMTATAYLSYSIRPGWSATAEVGTSIMGEFDGQLFRKNLWNKASFAIGTSISVF